MQWYQTYIDETIPEVITPEVEILALSNAQKLALFDAFFSHIPKPYVKQWLMSVDKNFKISLAAIKLIYTDFEAIGALCVGLAGGTLIESTTYDEDGNPIYEYYEIPATVTLLKSKVNEIYTDTVLNMAEKNFIIGKVIEVCKRNAAGAYVGTYTIFKEIFAA